MGGKAPPRRATALPPKVESRPILQIVQFRIPTPPSVNTLFKNRRGGRTKTDEYKAWIAAAAAEINIQRVGCIRFGADLRFMISFTPRHRGADLSNLIKAAEDICVRMSIIRDDSDVVFLSAEWGSTTENGAWIKIMAVPRALDR